MAVRVRKRIDPSTIDEMAKRALLLRMVIASSQAELARSLGITPKAWNNYECGYSRINLDMGLILCDRYGVSLDWLYRGQEAQLAGGFVSRLREAEAELHRAE